MASLNWEFNQYPKTELDEINGYEYSWSDLVLIKTVNGDVELAYYCMNKDEWYNPDSNEWIQPTQICCWVSYGKVPQTLTPMRRSK